MHKYVQVALALIAVSSITACMNQQDAPPKGAQGAGGAQPAGAPIPKAMLGVRMAYSGPALGSQLDIDPDKTTLITHVAEDTPAQSAGFERWDIIIAMDGATDASPASIRTVLRSSEPGDTVSFTILRADKQKKISAVLEKSYSERMVPLPPQPKSSMPSS